MLMSAVDFECVKRWIKGWDETNNQTDMFWNK